MRVIIRNPYQSEIIQNIPPELFVSLKRVVLLNSCLAFLIYYFFCYAPPCNVHHMLCIIMHKICIDHRKVWSRDLKKTNQPATLLALIMWMTAEMKSRMRATVPLRTGSTYDTIHHMANGNGIKRDNC